MSRPATKFRRRSPLAAMVLAFAVFLVPVSMALAHGYRLGEIAIGHIWAPPPDADGNTAVYVPILNEGDRTVYLTGVETDVTDRAVLRIVEDGKSRLVDRVAFEPGRPLALAPWREHIWLEHVKKPLKAGDSFDLALDFGAAGKVTVAVEVEEHGGH